MDHGIYIFLSLSILNFVRSILLLYSYKYSIVYLYISVISISVLNFATRSRQCINHPNCFCYICGELIPNYQLSNMTPLVKKVMRNISVA